METQTEREIALMLDIETLSLRPDAVILQVGYCVADLASGEYLRHPTSIHLDAEAQISAGRAVDFETVRWWLGQDKTVADGVFNAPGARQYTAGAHFELQRVVQACEVKTVWAAPAMFDLPTLTHAWKGRKPWGYRQERDMKTLAAVLDPHGKLKPEPNGRAHDAAADAGWQMDYLIRLWSRARELGLA